MTFVSVKTDIDRILRRQKPNHIPNFTELFAFLEIVTHWFKMKKESTLFRRYHSQIFNKQWISNAHWFDFDLPVNLHN